MQANLIQRLKFGKDILPQIHQHLSREGVVVLEDVFSKSECTKLCNGIADHLVTLCPRLNPKDLSTWLPSNLPGGPSGSLYHSLVGNFPTVWRIREDPRMHQIFSAAYSGLRGYNVTDFYTSIDGINVRPRIGPFQTPNDKDWAHLDQTVRNNTNWCVQGQVVLSDTTACLRASPRSHLIYDELLDIAGADPNDNSNWCHFSDKALPTVMKRVSEVGGQWQVPVRTGRGSVILWLSSVVHSSMGQLEEPTPWAEKDDPWADWRYVAYVCFRPKQECDAGHPQRLKECLQENKVSSHSGTKIFPPPAVTGSFKYEENLNQYMTDPLKMYNVMPLEITPEMKRLTEP
jgi:hypothetical protein